MFGVVGSQMYGWYGTGTRTARYTNILDPAPEPVVFSPLDISGCVLWLDANDGDTVEVNGDLSGANVNRVMKWFDLAQPSNQNYYTHIGNPAGSGLYNTHKMNGLNTIYFEPNAAMNHQGNGVTFDFQARTFFYVGKCLSDLSGFVATGPYIQFYNTTTPEVGVGYMNTGIAYDDVSGVYSYAMCENNVSCCIVFQSTANPLNQRMIVMFAQTDQIDLSGNAAAYDTAYQSLTQSDPADSYATGQSQYIINDPNYGTSQDIGEIIMYGRLLTTDEQRIVLDYLADKWNLSGPTGDRPPPPKATVEEELKEPEAPPEAPEGH